MTLVSENSEPTLITLSKSSLVAIVELISSHSESNFKNVADSSEAGTNQGANESNSQNSSSRKIIQRQVVRTE